MRMRTTAAALAMTTTGALLAGGLVAPTSTAAPTTPTTAAAATDDDGWHTSWAQSIQRRSGLTFTDRTLRQVSRLTQGGDQIRLRLENTFGTAPMVVDMTTVGLTATGPDIVPGTVETVLFDGAQQVTVPAGESVWSDPLDFTSHAQQDVTISFYVQNATVTTLHDRAGRTNWFAPNGGGNHAAAESGAAFTEAHGWNYIVGAVDVHDESLAGTVVAYGSSVVDGHGSESCGPGCAGPDPYVRWSDITSRRIVEELSDDEQVTLVNAGIGGTTASPACGSGGLDGVSRLSRDVLELSGVTALIYYYGTNDLAALGGGCSADAILTSMRATFRELRANGVDVIVTPVTPRPGYSAAQNARRSEINAFIRAGGDCSGTCDAVVDFDEALRDPSDPNRIRAEYDLDGLHVNTLGQRALAGAVDLGSLVPAVAAPAFSGPLPPAATVGVTYDQVLTASGDPRPRFDVVAGSLPDGLALEPTTGRIYGVPTLAGASNAVVRASNDDGHDELTVSIDVRERPAFGGEGPARATLAQPYDFTLTASGHPTPRFAVVDGALPAGLALDPDTGTIFGTPTSTGVSSFVVEASNAAGSVRRSASIDVVERPVFTSAAPPAGTVGLPYDHALQAVGRPTPTYDVSAGALPSGLRLDPRSGRITGTPTQAGSWTATVRASNGVGPHITTTLTIRVAAAASATVIFLDDPTVRYGAGTVARLRVFATGAAPSGQVDLLAGSAVVGRATLSPDTGVPGVSTATVHLPPRALPPGEHQLAARFSGDSRVLASAGATAIVVNPAVARLRAKVAGGRLTTRSRARLVARLRVSGVSHPGGRLVVRDGTRKVGTARVRSTGRVVVRLARLRPGRRALTVRYTGSRQVEPATARTRVRVSWTRGSRARG